MNDVRSNVAIKGQEHWTKKGDVNLFLWEKRAPGGPNNGTVLFVHGSSMASQPTFDLHVPGRPNSSAMEYFAEHGFDAWSIDMEGYGRSTKDRGTDAVVLIGEIGGTMEQAAAAFFLWRGVQPATAPVIAMLRAG